MNLCALFETKLRQEIKPHKYFVAKDNKDGFAFFNNVCGKNNAFLTVRNNKMLVF